MIKINGVAIKAPNKFDVGIMDITKGERNANGDMVLDLIATKRKVELEWAILSANEMSTLLTAISELFFEVSYPDPQTGAERTGTFYKGDRNTPGLTYSNGAMTWKGCKFNLIER